MIKDCPVCEGQGNIYNAKIIDLGITIRICDECEACWTEGQTIGIERFTRLTQFLKEHNLSYVDAKIENLEYVQEN